MDFSEALDLLKSDFQMFRESWNNDIKYVRFFVPGDWCKTLPYFFAITEEDMLVPWSANAADILAEDWQIY